MALLANISVSVGAIHAFPAALQVPQPLSYGLRAPILQTPRLRLRRWESRDVRPFVAMCADPLVTQFFTGPMAPIRCFEEMEQQELCFDARRYGVWAVELKDTGEFIGCLGFDPTMMAPKDNTLRLTWKFRRDCWGQNYAYEAAMEVIDYAFEELQVREVIAIVHATNLRSLRLAKRLGLAPRINEPDCYYKLAR